MAFDVKRETERVVAFVKDYYKKNNFKVPIQNAKWWHLKINHIKKQNQKENIYLAA